ncbi:MAG: RnfABCDGE type electron transport complex subunit G [bacterium]
MIKNIIKIGINLMIVSMIGATILATTNFVTAPKIEEVEKEAKLKARQTVLPSATEFKEFKEKKGFFKGLNSDGELVGYVLSCMAEGYGGGFWVMAGIDKNFKIVEINVLTNKETPGLGNKIEDDEFRNQFKGKGVENLEVVKTPPFEGKIQAITGATISSKAVTEAVKEGLEELERIILEKE